MPPHKRSRPDGNRGGSIEAIHPECSTSAADTATFSWRICPRHPWYGVSIIDTPAGPLCVPPLDGTPNHWVRP